MSKEDFFKPYFVNIVFLTGQFNLLSYYHLKFCNMYVDNIDK